MALVMALRCCVSMFISSASQRHQAWAERHGALLVASGLEDCGEAFDLVLNSSASSSCSACNTSVTFHRACY